MKKTSPELSYLAMLTAGTIQEDPAQAIAIAHLQNLYDVLVKTHRVSPPKTSNGFWARLIGRSQASMQANSSVRGLYFWGGVGRGKTFLMDIFYESLPFSEKKRMHFHRFMRHIHQQLKLKQGSTNPLKLIAQDFARETRVLCFDEFYVSDITDAMILAGLLEAMFANGLVLVTTSNIEPNGLYKNGLQRSKFLPAIDLLNKHTDVINVNGEVDYRFRALESAELYHCPLDHAAEKSLSTSFSALSPDIGERNVSLEIEGRYIPAKRNGDGVVWFEFSAVCEGARSQNDYIELAVLYQTVLISTVPKFTEDNEDAARRFISLIDEFYDHHVKLILSAEVPVSELYQGQRLVFEFQRTVSRLQEMQSSAYLISEHLP